MAKFIRNQANTVIYTSTADPSTSDKSMGILAEWRNTATGDVFDWNPALDEWVARVSGGSTGIKITVSATEPTSPTIGDLWVDIS